MTKLCDITDANTLAELEYNSGEVSYMDQAATHADDIEFQKMLITELCFMFSDNDVGYPRFLQRALLDILTSILRDEKIPDWVEPLIDKVAKERWG